MKILRSVNRRGFHIASAGFFTVLKANTWSPITRLVPGHQHPGRLTGGSEQTVGEAQAPRIITLNGHDPRLLRRGVIILAAMAITSVLLLWIIHPY